MKKMIILAVLMTTTFVHSWSNDCYYTADACGHEEVAQMTVQAFTISDCAGEMVVSIIDVCASRPVRVVTRG